jgi:ATP-dependent Lon protease
VVEVISIGGHPGARALWIEDSDMPSAKDEIAILRQDLVSLYEKFSLRFPGRLVPLNEELLSSASDEEFSFIIAGHVSFNKEEKHSLLETTSTRDRLRKEVECMKSMPPIQGRLI